jgi:hypothetical protein
MKPLAKRLRPISNWYQGTGFYTRLALRTLFGLGLFGLFTFIVAWRFPENYRYANFYAEDGSVFLQHILDHGFWHSFYTIFNGYLVVGLYLIEGIGILINHMIYGGNFIHLPQAFALASYMFFALCGLLPYLLLRQYWGKLVTIGIGLAVILVPMPGNTHAIIGTIGNLKWIFFTTAVFLGIYRYYAYVALGKKIILVDVALLLCAYTNVTSYLVVGLLAAPYCISIVAWLRNHRSQRSQRLHAFLKEYLRVDIVSYLVLLVFLLAQLVYIKIHGIPKIAGYLNTPFNHHEFIEVYIGRTIDYVFTFPFYKYMNDFLAVSVFVVFTALCAFVLRAKERVIALCSIALALVATAAFTLNRPGVGDEFSHYQKAGPDQFFYGQNAVVYIAVFLLLAGISRRFLKPRLALSVLAGLSVIFLGVNYLDASHFRNNNVMENMTATYVENVQSACQSQTGAVLTTQNYPLAGAGFLLRAPHKGLCNAYLSKHYGQTLVSSETTAHGDFFLLSTKPVFTQTFKASDDKLDGISLFISTFQGKRLNNQYTLHLYDATCNQLLRSKTLGLEVFDNTYYRVHFAAIEQSKDRSYCFTVTAGNSEPQDLALQYSFPNQTANGMLRIQGKVSSKAVVYETLYDPYH